MSMYGFIWWALFGGAAVASVALLPFAWFVLLPLAVGVFLLFGAFARMAFAMGI